MTLTHDHLPSQDADTAMAESASHAAGQPAHDLAAVILAAGQGTRMRSARHKVLHPLAGKPLLLRVLDLMQALGAEDVVVVLGHLAEQVREVLPPSARTVIQPEQLGTGQAVQVAAATLQATGPSRLLVHYGDVALVREESLRRVLAENVSDQQPLVLLTTRVANPRGYGRVLRRADGASVLGIVEEVDATDEQRAVDEIWGGSLLADTAWLWQHLPRLERRSTGELYLTDLVGMACAEGRRVAAVMADEEELHGVNDRAQLARANAILWGRVRSDLMRAGVTLLDPATTFISPEVRIAPDVLIHPGCHLLGTTTIGTGSEIGPQSYVIDSEIGDDTRIWYSVLEGARVGHRVSIGPFSHLRPGAIIEDDARLGNYAEVKASRIGSHTEMHHFSYVGDADVGEYVNIAAGVITANYDGKLKHRTVIGDHAFIGTDTTLRAPITVGPWATTGAGAVATHDIPAGEVWVGVPARPLRSAPPAGADDAQAPEPDG